MFWGTYIIREEELVGLEIDTSYNIVSGVSSSQFLGRSAQSAKLRLIITNRVLASLQQIEEIADSGRSRGLDVSLSDKSLQGIFACTAIKKTLERNVLGQIS